MSLVLALEHSCPWPREGRSLASDCFVSLPLASSLVFSTPPICYYFFNKQTKTGIPSYECHGTAAINFYPAVDHGRSLDFILEAPKPQITCKDVIRNFQQRKFWGNKDIVKRIHRGSFCATKKMISCGLVCQKLKS